MSDQAPMIQTLRQQIPAVGAGADTSAVIAEAPYAGTVERCVFIPNAAITGAATNNRTHVLTNRGQAGAGTTVVATLAYDNAVNAAARDAKAIPLSGTPANLVVASGDVLTFDSTHVGTGIAEPGGEVIIDIRRT